MTRLLPETEFAGFYDAADICTGDYADDCEAAGIS